ncbi:excinuclease ABC subunit A [Paracoccus broussonetiae]|uniref:excinuclease ABC subunit A n=1 Tax=Paracoccus broussonetiae TaxID=3075834 RepID=UPI002889D356|nr:excinuclease ABC subunit A [Paracoccus sp. CPCC 101403]
MNGCPPGLAKKGNGCYPPGHARRHDRHHRDHRDHRDYRDYRALRVGDRYAPADYRRVLADPNRYELERRSNWNYYQDDNQIYRVDNHTNKVLGVISLMQALSGR